MTANSVLLRRAMNFLDLSGVGLARMISDCREDGKVTAPETVSRWLSGTNPVDPAVIGWLTALVRVQVRAMPPPRLVWPAKQSIMIAVANRKGGIGKTVVAQNLAVVAARDCRVKTTHFSVGERGDSKFVQRCLDFVDVDSRIVSCEEMLNYVPDVHEVVIADISNEATRGVQNDDTDAFLRRFHPDMYLVPADFGSAWEAQGTANFTNMEGLNGVLRLLHRPRIMSMDFGDVARESGFDVGSALFCPQFIPQSVNSPPHIPAHLMADWQNPEQHVHYINLFSELVDALGGEVREDGYIPAEIEKLHLEALLDYADAAQRRQT